MKVREKVMIWFVWKLPRQLVYWCAVRVAANATNSKYSDQAVPEVTTFEALERWMPTKEVEG